MSSDVFNAGLIGAFYVIIFICGFFLSRYGKPYPMALFTLHKLAAVAAVVYLILIIRRLHHSSALMTGESMIIIVTVLLLIITIVSGGLTSLDKPMPACFLWMHKLLPYAAVAATAVVLYGFMGKR
ncbi:MAG: hypothetical protein EHM72_07225 [Calditrichaeota bacterium]|nr:MAG: hypothetical protein EHM72_07225 [Calditrichota bacterium]